MPPLSVMPPLSRIGRLLFLVFIVSASGSDLCAQFHQQAILVGSGAEFSPPPGCACPTYTVSQGSSVALSSDGNTAVVNGFGDNNGVGGAVWIFTRSNGVWRQEGDKLIGAGASGQPYQCCPAISGDGNTILFLGLQPGGGGNGFTWVFTRDHGAWSQQGGMLIGNEVGGPVYQGITAALTMDGNTAIVAGYNRVTLAAYAWIFARTDGIWTQQGSRLEGSEPLPEPTSTSFVSLSADGGTALVNNSIFTRNRRGIWREAGSIAAPAGPAAFSAAAQSS